MNHNPYMGFRTHTPCSLDFPSLPAAINNVVSLLTLGEVEAMVSPRAFDEDMHFSDGGSPLMAQYLLVVDALNFCFWPGDHGFACVCVCVVQSKQSTSWVHGTCARKPTSNTCED